MILVKKQILILPFILLSLLLGIWTGWIKLGWSFPLTNIAPNHGAIMAGGFIGTLICLERALGFKNKIALIVPAISSLSIIFFLFELPVIAYIMLLLGSIGLVIMYLVLLKKSSNQNATIGASFTTSSLSMLIMLIGAICWLLGNAILLKTYFYPSAVMWWIAFLFFTITGERIELSRYLNITKFQKSLLIIFMLVYIIGILIPFHDSGGYIIGFSLIASATWLFKYDMARKSLKGKDQIFYSGLVLLFGYGWLIVCGLIMAYGTYSGMLFYDASLHSFFLGFVFSMIFAHAPIILPGVLRLTVNPFNKSLYIWFILLQLSLILRILSAFMGIIAFKHSGGLFNGIAIIGFFVTMAVLVMRGKKKDILVEQKAP